MAILKHKTTKPIHILLVEIDIISFRADLHIVICFINCNLRQNSKHISLAYIMYNKHLWHDVNVGILHDFCSRPATIHIVIEIFQLELVAFYSRKKYLGKPIIYIRFLVEQTIGPYLTVL